MLCLLICPVIYDGVLFIPEKIVEIMPRRMKKIFKYLLIALQIRYIGENINFILSKLHIKEGIFNDSYSDVIHYNTLLLFFYYSFHDKI